MEQKTFLNLWKYSALGLLFLNLTLLGTLWMNRDHSREAPHGPKAADFLIEQLKFEPSRLEAFNKLKSEHHAAVEALREKGKALHHEFFSNLKTDKPDSAKVRLTAQALADNQEQIELVTFRHFVAVRKLCNEQQRVIFDDLIEDVLRRMAGPPGPPPPPERN